MEVHEFFSERRFSRIEEEFPNKEAFPLYYTANKTEITIGPGQGLFIPAGWFHFVFSEGDLNVAANFWHKQPDYFEEGKRSKDAPIQFTHTISELNLDENQVVEVTESTRTIVGTKSIMGRCRDATTFKQKTIKEFLEERNPLSYIVQDNSFSHLKEYAIDKTRPVKDQSVWINFGGVYTHLHYDLNDNYLCQVKGQKRILLFPPEDRDLLYLWNPYSLDVIFSLRLAWFNDEFIHNISDVIPVDVCEEILANGIQESHIKSLTDVYWVTLKTYHSKIECAVNVIPDDPVFKVIHTSDISNHKLSPQFANIIFFLKPSTAKVMSAGFKLNTGDALVFPNTYTFKWWIDDTMIIIAEEAPQST